MKCLLKFIEWLTFAEIILTHLNVLNVHFSSNIYLSSENIKFEIKILRNITKHTTFGIILKSVITRHAENVYQIWFCLLSELTILTSFFFLYVRLFGIFDAIITMPGYFQMKNMIF